MPSIRRLRSGSTSAVPYKTMYGSVSSSLHVLNEFLKPQKKVIVVTLSTKNMDDPNNPNQADLNQAQIEGVQVVTLAHARSMPGYSG